MNAPICKSMCGWDVLRHILYCYCSGTEQPVNVHKFKVEYSRRKKKIRKVYIRDGGQCFSYFRHQAIWIYLMCIENGMLASRGTQRLLPHQIAELLLRIENMNVCVRERER